MNDGDGDGDDDDDDDDDDDEEEEEEKDEGGGDSTCNLRAAKVLEINPPFDIRIVYEDLGKW